MVIQKWNKFLFIFMLLLLIGGVIVTFVDREKGPVLPELPSNQKEKDIFDKARQRFMLWRERGMDFTTGPCLGEIEENWVLDIVHFPKTAEDDLPQNQCPEFLTGKAEHIIELNDNGDFVSMK